MASYEPDSSGNGNRITVGRPIPAPRKCNQHKSKEYGTYVDMTGSQHEQTEDVPPKVYDQIDESLMSGSLTRPEPPPRTRSTVTSQGGASLICSPAIQMGDVSENDEKDVADGEYCEFYPLSPGRTEHMFLFLAEELGQIRDNMTDPSTFKFEQTDAMESDKYGVNICGNENDIELGREALGFITKKIYLLKKNVTKPGFIMFLSSDNGLDQLQKVEDEFRVTIDTSQSERPKQDCPADTRYVLETAEGIRISLHSGSIADEKLHSDVIVNGVFYSSGTINHGRVTKCLFEKGGDKVRDQYNKKSKSDDRLIKTTGGNLGCRKIYHIRFQMWEDDNSEQCEADLADLIRKCLTKANKSKQQSIAFPALGTGNLKYPADVVAKMIFEQVGEFGKETKNPILNRVKIILYAKDENITEAFHTEFKERSERLTHGQKSSFTYTDMTPEGIWIMIAKGCISDEEVDGIVNSTSSKLNLSYGQISKILLEKGERMIQEECKRLKPKGIEYGEIVATSGGKLPYKRIYHGAISKSEEGSGGVSEIIKVVSSSLLAGHDDNLKSIALPILGTGNLGYPLRLVMKTILKQVQSFSKEKQWTTLKDIRVLVYDDETLKRVKEFIESELHTFWIPYVSTEETFVRDFAPTEKLTLNIYGCDQSLLEQAFDYLDTIYMDNQNITMLDTAEIKQKIRLLDEETISRLRAIQNVHGIYIEVNKADGFIKLEGYQDNVDPALDDVEAFMEDLAGNGETLGLLPSTSTYVPGECISRVKVEEYSSEFRDVKKSICDTKGPESIVKIERIQNKTLFHQYAARKTHMAKCDSKELTLFHGTTEDAVPQINRDGFNRSFCGPNGTMFGEGVYFARDASYSSKTKYSRKSKAGSRYMYRCKILVGRYTKGERNMKVLPVIRGPGAERFIRYDTAVDNVADPTIFVIFHDCQAYPEYLITFM